MKIRTSFGILFGLLFAINTTVGAELPAEKDIQAQLELAKKAEQTDDAKINTKNLEDTLVLLEKLAKQKSDNNNLTKQIQEAEQALAQSQQNIANLKQKARTPEQIRQDLASVSLASMQKSVDEINHNLQQTQADLTALNANLSTQKSAPERAQTALTANIARTQEINTALSSANTPNSLKTKLEVELEYLLANNSYNQIQLNGSDALANLYTSQLEEKNIIQQQLQTELVELQTAINNRNLEESQDQVEQANAQKNNNKTDNPIIAAELDLNSKVSEELLKQTTQLNALSQDNLRIKTILDNLQQTQRNIDEQISSLQGTLVLSRIINKQRQSLPQDEMISGLSKQIADLRVKIFDVSEYRDKLNNTSNYIDNLAKEDKIEFTEKERAQLKTIVEERSRVLSDLLKQLNSQLNLSINIELNQQQVQTISDTLQNKLQQQSFWVKSNAQIDLDWLKNFPTLAGFQLREISKKFDFSNWQDNLGLASFLIAFLALLTLFITKQKVKIKQHLTHINNKLKTLGSESQWHTPTALFWTLILCLPSTFIFLMVFILVSYLCFQNPTQAWSWGLKMAGYWLYFAFMLALLRPNGIAHRHFKMPQKSSESFRRILKRSVWLVALLLNTAILTNLEMGVAYDVIGEVVTISVLVLTLFMVGPEFRQAISSYQQAINKEQNINTYMLTFVRLILFLAPLTLIVLIALGYYYTALVLIEHLVSSYLALITWLIFRNVIYRGFEVSSRRLAARRLKEKREQAAAKLEQLETVEGSDAEEFNLDLQLQDDSLAISQVKDQVLRLVDFLLWVGLFTLLYFVWSDLITVAYYLNGVTLWQQSVTTETGTVMESVTLLNLLVACVIIFVTYVVIRNISGLLEVVLFSNVKLSQGTPYTITTLLTYLIIALGAALAFGMLGMSWSKLQWLFAALSVGLGFGMQEIFANFVSGIIILFERPVRIGDVITIGQFSGTVSKIRIRATTLVDFDGKEVIVPNKAFVTERLVNWALNSSTTRVVIKVGVAYGSNLDLVRDLLLQAASESDRVMKDPAPRAYFLAFGASTLDHELRVYVEQISDRTTTTDFLNRRINQLFAQNNIEIAFNQLDIYIKNQQTNEEIKVHSGNLA
ncbi:hypothetical protein A4G18_01230 [Pasteurellaceae bacterium Pebbles2]|nr:hypothetical protein [Pasteurellaceae bacterium Pebbles2]